MRKLKIATRTTPTGKLSTMYQGFLRPLSAGDPATLIPPSDRNPATLTPSDRKKSQNI